MKILHIASHAGMYRGGAVQLTRLALAQRARGHEVGVIVNVGRKARRGQRAADRATWVVLDDAQIPVRPLRYETLLGRMRLKRAILAGRFDVVHVHRDQALVAAWHALRGSTQPALVAQRGTVSSAPEEPMRAFLSSRVGAVVGVAQAVKNTLAADGVPGDKIHVVYGSVDVAEFAPRPPDESRRAALGIPSDAPVIGSLSAWRRGKGLEDLIAALGQALPRHPGAHAVLLGRAVPEKLAPHVDALPADVAARIHLLDHQAKVADWLSIICVTVVAATAREGLSGVLRESLAMEIPVISTDCAGNNEIVRHHDTGLLIPPGDPAAMAAAIGWVLEHPAEMKTMARAGRAWVLAHCTPAAQAAAIDAIYASLLNR